MNTAFAGQFFLKKNYPTSGISATGRAMKEKTHTKLNISIPTDLHSWVVEKKKTESKKLRYGKVGISNIVADCIERAKLAEERDRILLNEGNDPAPDPANVVNPSANFDGGSSTRRITTYRQAGKRK
jgi:hypothetical protein